MKKLLLKALLVCTLVLVLPLILTLLFSKKDDSVTFKELDFTIYYELNGLKEELSFDDYLLGVIAANMPAGYATEALKAQAVIARTYALYNIALLSKDNPGKNTFSTSELGLSYLESDSLEDLWGRKDYSSYHSRLKNAVFVTKDEVITYNSELILPVFFNTGSGYTRNASEAWNIDIPYLVSVESRKDVTSTSYLKIQEYTISDLLSLLNNYYSGLRLTEKNFFDKVKIVSRDSTDYVIKIDLGSLSVSGEEFAKVLGLPSSHYYIENYEGNVRIICNGSGHGIGLSQYGANAMAEDGSSYQEILKYYYSGVEINDLSEKN